MLMLPKVAALFVQTGGVYFGLPDVEPWDESRDARLYMGPWPVVAHPPCNRWGAMAYANQAQFGYKVGDDGGCFAHALSSVTLYGGVLEHPAYSHAFERFSIPRPLPGSWQKVGDYDYVTQVSQVAYGHPARKRTWLLLRSVRPPPALDWSEPPAKFKIGGRNDRDGSPLKRTPATREKGASATPLAFRDVLLKLARDSVK